MRYLDINFMSSWSLEDKIGFDERIVTVVVGSCKKCITCFFTSLERWVWQACESSVHGSGCFDSDM